MGKALDLRGRRFGRLTTVEATRERHGGHIVWRCICDCGEECSVDTANLHSGNTKSCGCWRKENRTKHGMCGTPTYYSFDNMHSRCNNPSNPQYKDYGGRGISICERWHKFENFYADMGERPKGKSLDRWPDNDGNYEPNNCRWATPKEQNVNSRPISCGPAAQYFFYGHGPNEEMIIWNNQCEIARKFGLHSSAISRCLRGKESQHKGWIFQRI